LEAFRPRHHDLANPFDLAAFKAELLGEVILPGQSDYDRARQIHDLTYDRHPTMIVRAAGQGERDGGDQGATHGVSLGK